MLHDVTSFNLNEFFSNKIFLDLSLAFNDRLEQETENRKSKFQISYIAGKKTKENKCYSTVNCKVLR